MPGRDRAAAPASGPGGLPTANEIPAAGATSTRARRAALQGLVAAGGIAALSWEVIWQLEASLALGASALGAAIALAATMGGMTLGSLAAARLLRARHSAHPVRLYGWLELAIGASGLVLLPGFEALERIDAAVFAAAPAASPALAAAGIAVLLGVPTAAMGASLPVFARIGASHGVSLARLYGANTLGATAGVLLLAFALLPALGVAGSVWLVACLNTGVFVAARWVRPGLVTLPDAQAAASRPPPRLRPAAAAAVVFCTGFATFALEVAWFRSLRAAFQSVTEVFALMLASVLLPLALGARLAPRLRARGVALGWLLAAAGAAVLLATPLVERMDLLALVSGSYGLILLKWLGLCLAVLGPPMLLLGTALPWCLEESPESGRAGALYAANTVGAVLGALLAGFALLPALGFARSAWIAGAGISTLALALLPARARALAAAAGAGALVVAVANTASLGRERVQGYAHLHGHRVLAYDEGPDSTLSVVEEPDGGRVLLIDGFAASSEGGFRDTEYMEWMGRLPMLLHPDPRDALVICFGTGRTANAVREEGPERLDVVELDSAVFEMAPHFARNGGVLDDPRVRAVAMDGRAWLRRTERRYDVITLEPMPPHFAGVNALYSREFYEIAARRLLPGGVAAQWLPLHILPPFYAASVAATFRSVFPDAMLWFGRGSSAGILLGRASPGPGPLGRDWPGLAREQGGLVAYRIRRGLLLEPQALARFARLGRIISDDNQLLAYGRVRGVKFTYGGEMERENLLFLRAIARGEAPSRLPEPTWHGWITPR